MSDTDQPAAPAPESKHADKIGTVIRYWPAGVKDDAHNAVLLAVAADGTASLKVLPKPVWVAGVLRNELVVRQDGVPMSEKPIALPLSAPTDAVASHRWAP